MHVASRVWLALAGFLLIAGTIYGFTSHEYAGTTLLFVGGATFAYLAFVGWTIERVVEGAEPGAAEEPEAQVVPTIWPFAFSIAGLVLLVGVIVSRWIVAVGVMAFALAATGWLRQVLRARASERT